MVGEADPHLSQQLAGVVRARCSAAGHSSHGTAHVGLVEDDPVVELVAHRRGAGWQLRVVAEDVQAQRSRSQPEPVIVSISDCISGGSQDP